MNYTEEMGLKARSQRNMSENQVEMFEAALDEFFDDDVTGITFRAEEEDRVVNQTEVMANVDPDLIADFISLSVSDTATLSKLIELRDKIQQAYSIAAYEMLSEAVLDYFK